jgi:EpsI family protein
MKNIKFYAIVFLLIVSGLLSWNFYLKIYRQSDTVDIHQFPKTIGDWTAREMTITDLEYSILETRNAFSREYTNSAGKSVYVFIVYSQSNRKVSHPPEICYTGGGLAILEHVVVPFHSKEEPAFFVNRLHLEQKGFRQNAYYWFKVGDTFTPIYWKQQFLIASKTLLGKPSSSAMVRLSADVKDGDSQQADQLAQSFAQLITPLLYQYLP